MPSQNHKRILAIDPGTRLMGVAVLDHGDLVYHGVETLGRAGSPHERLREGRRIVSRMLRDFRPGVLALEKTFFAKSRNTALLNVFADEIQALGRKRKLSVVSFAPSTVKKHVTGDGQATKAEVARAVIKRFPELRAYLTPDRKWKARYHSNRFDAVAVGMTALDQLEEAA